MVNNEKTINDFRAFMTENKIDFFIINATDEYLNEYVDLKINPRFLLTGFSGSTGDAIITNQEIFLFVDGRYHLQAEKETDKNLITVIKVYMDTSPQQALVDKITELAEDSSSLGVLSKKISYSYFKKLSNLMKDKNISIKEFDTDPVLDILKVKESEDINNLRLVPMDIAGVSPEEKLKKLNENLKVQKIDALLLTKLEEIAYISNLRGNEIPYSSSFKAKAFINEGKCLIFCKVDSISSEIKKVFGNKFEFRLEEDFDSYITVLKNTDRMKIAFDVASTNLNSYRALEKTGNDLIELIESPVAIMKSVKNSSELKHMRECFRKTDIVVSRSISWLKQSLEKGMKISEKDFSARVKELFLEEGAYGLSFEVISASGTNTAVIHYTNSDPQKYIAPNDLVLLDCGAYFEGGYATDITRTFLAGGTKVTASEKAKEIYTKVLKSFLNGLYFPVSEETTGFDIDKKVRDVLISDVEEDFKFSHSTGHGLGIPVHEVPPRVGPSEFSKTKITVGMCFTIEPGLYKNGWGGVRLENTVNLVENDGKLQIQPLGRASFDQNLIDFKYLNEQEISWLSSYNKKSIGA